jgi:hypothetical protein
LFLGQSRPSRIRLFHGSMVIELSYFVKRAYLQRRITASCRSHRVNSPSSRERWVLPGAQDRRQDEEHQGHQPKPGIGTERPTSKLAATFREVIGRP